jgi:cytochrome c biogenesis protein CcmG/thiol:disulfide interchange protein DsbE
MRAAPVLLLLALLAAGCTAPQAAPVRARAGDFVVADLAAWDAQGNEVANVTSLHAVMASRVPSRLPEAWDANATDVLPPGVVAALTGLAPGARAETGLLQPEEAYGNWSADRAIRAPRIEVLPRDVRVNASALRADEATWAGQAWNVEVIEREGGDARVRLLAGPENGTMLELPSYWNEHYHLWRSRLAGLDEHGLHVEHLAEPGEVLVGGVTYRVRTEATEVLADGNLPLAGQALRFRVALRDVVFAGSEAFPHIPEAMLVRATGERFNLSDLRGTPMLLDFFASWCVTCKQQAPILARSHAEFPALQVLSVTIDPTDDAGRLRAFQEDAERSSEAVWGRALPANWTFAFDPLGEAARGFSVAGIPREVLVDSDGRIRATSVGLHPWPELRGELEELLQP